MFSKLVDNVSHVVVGKETPICQCAAAMVVGGHILLEDNPGTGKTQLARGLANSIDMQFKRIQFTPDLLPSDVVGVTYYDQKTGEFEYREGPIFASIVLADEINRASPKTQSALLEVMEEQSVTVNGVTHPVPQPFMVIATQNPIEQLGTYKLPEAQMDRFLIKTTVGHPSHDVSVDILRQINVTDRAATVHPVLSGEDVLRMRGISEHVRLDDSILEYRAAGRSHPPQRAHPSRVLHARRTGTHPVCARLGSRRQSRIRGARRCEASRGCGSRPPHHPDR